MKGKNNAMTASVLGVALALVFVLAGLAIPMTLLKKQEAGYLGMQTRSTARPTAYAAPDPTPLPQAPHMVSEEDLARYHGLLTCYKYSDLALREPGMFELSMEQAAETARAELGILIDLGAVPELGTGSFRLRSAELYGLTEIKGEAEKFVFPPAMGVWVMNFLVTGGEYSLVCDSQTGLILSVEYSEPEGADAAECFCRLMRFFEYYGAAAYENSVYCESDVMGRFRAASPFAVCSLIRLNNGWRMQLSDWDDIAPWPTPVPTAVQGAVTVPSVTPTPPEPTPTPVSGSD